MTVATSSNRVDYTGNGSTTVFSFNFRILAATDLVVTKADTDGVETELVLNTDYTVSGVGSYSGGSITLASALTDGYALTIVRQVPITQETDLRNQGSFFAETHEDVFDRLTMVAQQLQEQIDRSAKLPVTRTEDADALVADIVLLADNISDLDALAANLSDITTVADDLNEPVSEIETVAGSIANVNTVGNNINNVNTVAGISANVTTVAGIQANVTTVAGISSAVSNVSSISSAVSGVNSNATNINTVAGINANVTTVAGISSDVTTVAGIASDVSAVENIAANVTTVAGISSAVSTVATNNTNVSTVATNIANVNTVATNIVDVQNAEENATAAINAKTAAEAARDAALAALDSFDDRYLGQKTSDPTLDNDGDALITGALYFNTADDVMKVYEGSIWVSAYASLSGALLSANNLSDLTNAATARSNLGVDIGTHVQAYDPDIPTVSASQAEMEAGSETALRSMSPLRVKQAITALGFPSGTAMLFAQTAAPTGWTKSTTHNNKALRVVSGTAGSGGSVSFTSAFTSQSVGGTVGDTTLTTAQLPSHTHPYYGYTAISKGSTGTRVTSGGSTATINSTLTSGATGSANSHNHSFTGTAIDLAVQYVDVIIATKD